MKRVQVNLRFVKNLFKLLKMAIFKNGVFKYFIVFNMFLIIRTFLTIWISIVKGKIVKSIISSNQASFLKNMGNLALLAFPGSFTNSCLSYFQNIISLNIRKGLMENFSKGYLKDKIFYQLTNVDSRIQNPDQILTEDIKLFSERVALLYSDFSKPFLDIILFSRKLSQILSFTGPSVMIFWYILSGFVIKLITPSFGMLIAEGLRLEGVFRSSHQRLIQHSEEIAFLRGGAFELKHVQKQFTNLMNLSKHENLLRFFMGILDSILTKYGAYNIGLSILAIPVFGPNKEKYLLRVGNDPSKIMKDYEQNSSLLVNLAKAIAKIVISYKNLQNLAGTTARVYDLLKVIQDLSVLGRYQRNLIANKELIYDDKLKGNALYKGKTLNQDDCIKVDSLSVITPDGEMLLDKVVFKIVKDMNCVIIGPNGCGKTALLRVLAGLWPFFQGKMFKASSDQIFFLPQIPYFPKGNLRDAIIYPDTVSEKTDYELLELMDIVKLRYLHEKNIKGFEQVEDWFEQLSGGEKQRLSMIRMIYHNPVFAVLDEATSAISVDIENELYMQTKNRGITLITVVTQKKAFYYYHNYVFKIDGFGNWEFDKIDSSQLIL